MPNPPHAGRGDRPVAPRPRVPPAARDVGPHQHRRRRRARRRAAAGRLPDARPVPRLDGGCSPRTCRCCCSASRPASSPTGSTGVRIMAASTSSGRPSSPSSRRRSSAAPSASRSSSSRCSCSAPPRRSPTSAARASCPRLVRREDLGIANARLSGGVLLTNQLLAPPIGAAPVRRRDGAAVRRRCRRVRAGRRC